MINRISDAWEREDQSDLAGLGPDEVPQMVCARCGEDIGAGEEEMEELIRVVAARHGALVVQGVSVHRRCWDEGRGDEEMREWARDPDLAAMWRGQMAAVRSQLREMDGADEGDEWLA